MRSFGKNDLPNLHVIEAMWFVFSQNACRALIMNSDDDCLTKAKTNYTYGKLTDVLLFHSGSILMTEYTYLKFCHGVPTQGLMQGKRTASLPVDNEADTIRTARVYVFSDSVLCIGHGAMNDVSGMWKHKADLFLDERILCQLCVDFRTANRIHLASLPGYTILNLF